MLKNIGEKLIQNSNFGDKRLSKRFGNLVDQLLLSFGDTIPAATKNRSQTKAAYNFFANEKVVYSKIIKSEREGSLFKHTKEKTLLFAQDTTELDYQTNRISKTIRSTDKPYKKGMYLHNHIMLNHTGVPLGLFSQKFWDRDEATFGKNRAKRKSLPIEKKESYRWLKCHHLLQKYAKTIPDTTIFDICDREADFYEILQAKTLNNVENCHYIIRSKTNRRILSKGLEDNGNKLWNEIIKEPIQSIKTITITDETLNKKREVKIGIKYKKSILKPTHRRAECGKTKPTELFVVEAREVVDNTSGGNKNKDVKPILWYLLTTYEIKNKQDAEMIVRYYSYRWRIETFHWVLKTGCGIEKLQIQKVKALKNAVSMYSIIAIKILLLRYLAEIEKDKSEQTTVDKIGITYKHFSILYQYVQKNHGKIGFKCPETISETSVTQLTILLATIGGNMLWKNKPIGTKTIWRGFRDAQIILNTTDLL